MTLPVYPTDILPPIFPLDVTSLPPRSLHQKAERFHSHAEEFKVLQHERCFYTNFLYASLRKFIFIFQTQVWLKVWKVISKMLEENEKFRHRLLTCSQFNGESK